MSVRLVTTWSEPELVEREEIWRTWPAFMHHDPVARGRWDALYDRFPAFQFFAVEDETDVDPREGERDPLTPRRRAVSRTTAGEKRSGQVSTTTRRRPSSPRCRSRSILRIEAGG